MSLATLKRVSPLPACTLLLLVIAACSGGTQGQTDGTAAAPQSGIGAAPSAATPYARAGVNQLPARKPQELPGLHNVFQLSAQVISGSEPHGTEGLQSVAALGVKTIISVDGQAPDAERARALGLRYVHVPIQYRGISSDELMHLAKTFRECEAPFYLHCFHGRHRGPAAAGIGRRVLDGVTGATAAAEMRQWMGTGEAYQGLFATVLDAPLPEASATQASAFAFPSVQQAEGVVEHMTFIGRAYDALEALKKHGWKPDAKHPDLDAGSEARKLADHMQASWAEEGRKLSRGLVEEQDAGRDAARALLAAITAKDGAAMDAAFVRVDSSCKDCHKRFRNK